MSTPLTVGTKVYFKNDSKTNGTITAVLDDGAKVAWRIPPTYPYLLKTEYVPLGYLRSLDDLREKLKKQLAALEAEIAQLN